MSLQDLPKEVGIQIFKYLDIKSKISAYSINELKGFFAPSIMTKVDISRSSVASVRTLSLSVLQDYAVNIQELNLSGIQELTADRLAPYLQAYTNLKTLDVTFTTIFLSDIELICCNNLKNICINYFQWPRTHVQDEVWKKTSDIFKRQKFERVHFVVFAVYDSESPLKFMEDIPITKDLKVTLADSYRQWSDIDIYRESVNREEPWYRQRFEEIGIHFERLSYIFRNCRLIDFDESSYSINFLCDLDYTKIEYILIMYEFADIYIYVSPIFSRMFSLSCPDLSINIHSRLPLRILLQGNVIFKAWNKEITVFNEEFYKKLLNELTDYFPTYICMDTKVLTNITTAPSNWYCIDSCDTFNILDTIPENLTFTDFCKKDSVTRSNGLGILISELQALANITFLSIRNICVKWDFFTNIFLKCKRLYTLDVYFENDDNLNTYSSYTQSLFNSMHVTKSLKNLKINLENIEYGMVFDSLSQCPSLENVSLCEYDFQVGLLDYEAYEEKVLLLIERCCNLYSVFIEAMMDPDDLTMLNMLKGGLRNAAQSLDKNNLCIEVCNFGDSGWNPFDDVFNPSPLDIKK